METPQLSPHAKYASALRRFERIRHDHPERRGRHSAMVAAADELVAFERGRLENMEMEERLATRRKDRAARLALRDARYDQKRRARRSGR